MKNSLRKFSQAFFCFLITLSCVVDATAQNCDQRYGGTVGGLGGTVDFRLEEFRHTTPTDLVTQNGNGGGVQNTCRGCYPGDVHANVNFSKGGSATVTNYSKEMVIEFSEPVADLEWEINGAAKVTDNRGYTIHMPDIYQWFKAKFPGGGITRITITDPYIHDVYYPNGTLDVPGFWQIDSINVSWSLDSTYQQCNCNQPTFPRPAPASIASPDWNSSGSPEWTIDAEVSDDDGLVLKNIRLEDRYMAAKISVPYFTLVTNSVNQRGELTPTGVGSQATARLVSYRHWSDEEKLVVQADYAISQIPAGMPYCLIISQRYEFWRSLEGDKCEPSGSVPCARWKPIIKYKFIGPPNELQSLTIPQRQHLRVNGISANATGLFRDCDNVLGCLATGGLVFKDKINPLLHELGSNVISGGQNQFHWDNFHQTFHSFVDEPATFPNLLSPGCPEGVHTHWRWGAHLGKDFGSGKPLIEPSSNQDVNIAVVAHSAAEEDPTDYRALFATPEELGTLQFNVIHENLDFIPKDVVFWYSSTGHKFADTFYPLPGSFFNPAFQGHSAEITHDMGGGGAASAAKSADSVSVNLLTQDAPESIAYGDFYADGPATFSVIEPAAIGILPPGYTIYEDDVFDVKTDAVVSGSHVVTFSVPSVTTQAAFDNLRILHVEPDSLNPTRPSLVDRTILTPEVPSPDFTNKKISARVTGLGTFVITSYSAPPANAMADLSVAVSHAPETVAAGSNLIYTVTVTNNGPQAANGVMFRDGLAPEAVFISATPSQGTCTEVDGSVLCDLNSLAVAASATITVVVRPIDGGIPLPPGGKLIQNVAIAKANENDANLNNNSTIDVVNVSPDPNLAPTVSIVDPATGASFIGPTNLTISATAVDADGSVTTVEFYDNGTLLASGTLNGDQYQLAVNGLSYGSHTITAVATDDLGKKRVSEPVNILVNGSAMVSITSPANYITLNKPANVAITIAASIPGGTISKVDLYADSSIYLGTASVGGPGQYSLTWSAVPSGQHVLTAVVTDNLDITTTSAPVYFTVNESPVISLTAPAAAAVFSPAPASISLTAHASDWDGYISRVDFYANGSLIGTNASHGVNQFTLSWANVPSGNYSLTAVAVDSAGASKTSAPVAIRVNTPPTVSLISPTSGTQFTTPTNIVMTATAADNDGSVSGVDFYANGNRIGSGTAIGGGQFSFAWNAVGIGNYALFAKAFDNNGGATSSATSNVSVNTPVLFVTGSTTLNASDAAVKVRLEALNSVVTVKDAASSVTADANGKSLVVISSTVTPTAVGTKFRTVAVPVIAWESGIFNNMGMTGSTNKDFGTKTNQTQVTITNATHPLASGLSGNVTVVTTGKTFDWGKPNANGISVAMLLNDSAKTAIFAYESGAVMPGLTAPARRVGLFLYDDTAASFNSNGAALLDAAIRWARGGGSISGSTSFSPTGLIDLTSEGLIDWAHWGLTGPTSFNHKASAPQPISNFTPIGTGAVGWFADNSTTCSWTDGTPTQITSNTANGINVNGAVGNGLQITVPADTNVRTLKLYVGAWYAQGKLEASLSDGSSPTYVDSSFNGNGGGTFGVYTINFKAGSTGQTMKIRFTILNQYFSPNGNLAWKAATLR